MLKYLYILLLFLFACDSKIEYYQGYICDQYKNPIANLKIYAKEDSENIIGITDEKGWVCIAKEKANIFLMIKRGDTIIDSIQVLRGGAEKISYFFTNLKQDTLFIASKNLYPSHSGNYRRRE